MKNVFTTSVVKESQRAEFWEKFVCKFISGVDCDIRQPKQFYGGIQSYTIGRFIVSYLQAAPHKVGLSADRLDINRNTPFMVIFQKSGTAKYSQCGYLAHLQPGDFVLYDPQQPYHMELPEPFEQILFQFPKSTLKRLTGSLSDIIGHPITGNSAGKDLCASLIDAFSRHIDDFNSEAMHSFSETIINLFIQVFDSELCRHAKGRINSVSGNTLDRAKQYIISNLKNNDLTLSMIAEHAGVSSRHLNRLFQADGPSVIKWAKLARLERSASALVNPSYAGKTVAEIAYEFGFNDISHFCRDFKKAYHLTPSAYRTSYCVN
ncbi:MAG: helix-turn-helix domain-containing protein [Pseudomonadales bacterium]|nr:helix-turn-helix domain-containing protein [Pseudomonadales bacterium]